VTVGRLMAYNIWLGVNGQRELRHATHGNINRDNVITPTLNTPTVITPTLITPTIITPTLNTSTVTDSLCNSGAFSNPNAVRDCPFNLKGAGFLSRGPTKYFLQK
jgi:hypothetical protein